MDFFDFIKNNKLVILIASVILNVLLCLTSAFLIYKNFASKTPEEIISPEDEIVESVVAEADDEKKSEDSIFAEVKGAVKNPGVFKVTKDYVINDLILLAGGFKKDAYTKNINLSRKVSDELVVYVYTSSEYKKKETESVSVDKPCTCPTYDISNCTEEHKSEIVSSSESSNQNTIDNSTTNEVENSNNSNNNSNNDNKVEEKTLVNINTATLNELMSISGIGESKAKSIIEYRNTNGNFKSIEDIKNVSGIGDALFAKIKDYITV